MVAVTLNTVGRSFARSSVKHSGGIFNGGSESGAAPIQRGPPSHRSLLARSTGLTPLDGKSAGLSTPGQ